MVALWKTEDGTVNVKTMVYLLGNVKQVLNFLKSSIKMMSLLQDWFVGLSTLESFVKYLKTTDPPDLKVLYYILNPMCNKKFLKYNLKSIHVDNI